MNRASQPHFTGPNAPDLSPTDTGAAWYSTTTPTVVVAPGSSADFSGYYITNFPMVMLPDYAPAANFATLDGNFLYVVETAEIPEPGTATLAMLALAGLAGLRRHSAHRRRSSSD